MSGWLSINRLLLPLLLLFTLSTQAETLEGKVVKIADGDTLTILTSTNQQVKVRLAGIDTPERKQPFGNRAKQALSSLAFQKQALVEIETKDRYGRTVGVVFVDGLNVNHELVKQGIAWVYRKYTSDKRLYALESEAKQSKRGLWLQENPIPPWEWRRGRR
ncbi:MAG: thermonuclease family protein [Gammaproteobacteria bacterium]|nr:thermonuclease family protein [Gammaproteobacteria bacterium]